MTLLDPVLTRRRDLIGANRAGLRQSEVKAELEWAIVRRIKARPGFHTFFSLYHSLRKRKYPAKWVQQAVLDLIELEILAWEPQTAPKRLIFASSLEKSPPPLEKSDPKVW